MRKDNEAELRLLARDSTAFLPARLGEYSQVTHFPGITNGVYQAEPAVFYRPGEMLTTDADEVGRASAAARLRVEYEVVEEIEPLGVQRLRIHGSFDVTTVTRSLNRNLAPQVGAAPNHIFTPAQIHGLGPGTDPLPCDAIPENGSMGDCGGIGVAVVDTGFFLDHYPTLSSSDLDDLVKNNSRYQTNDEEHVDANGDAVIDRRVAAHGGFIGGVIQSHLPGTPMSMQRAVGDDGLIDEVSVCLATLEGLEDREMGIVNLSLGTYVHAYSELVSLRATLDRILRERPDVLLVCAAGNDHSEDRWFPAAWADYAAYADAVVSVGALDTTGSRARMARFSNRGSWVTAWAPGVDIPSIYPTGLEYEYFNGGTSMGTLEFHGMAEWSGTSFAAPYAAASILAHAASHPGMTPREAWTDLRGDSGFVML